MAHRTTQSEIPISLIADIVDKTAAGDSFKVGFIGALIDGDTAECAARRAAKVVQGRGALVPV